jgi:hypothetical protein
LCVFRAPLHWIHHPPIDGDRILAGGAAEYLNRDTAKIQGIETGHRQCWRGHLVAGRLTVSAESLNPEQDIGDLDGVIERRIGW